MSLTIYDSQKVRVCEREDCNQTFEATSRGGRPKRFCSAACRNEAWRDRKGLRVALVRSQASQNVRSKRKPDLRISYRKALDAMIHYPGAEAKLRELLTDRQREALDA